MFCCDAGLFSLSKLLQIGSLEISTCFGFSIGLDSSDFLKNCGGSLHLRSTGAGIFGIRFHSSMGLSLEISQVTFLFC